MRLSELRAAITREGPSPGARAVWWAIAAHADGDGNAWPSLAVIAVMAGMSTRSVSARLRELEQAGMIETVRLANHRNRYHVVHSPEPQFRFPTGSTLQHPTGSTLQHPTGSTLHVNLKHASGRTRNDQRSDQPKRVPEVHNEGDIEGSRESRNVTDGSAATPLRGGGAETLDGRARAGCDQCASGWVYNIDGDVHPCPTCRPVQYHDTVTTTTGTRRRDLE